MSRMHSVLFLAGALALGLLVGPYLRSAPKGDLVTRASWKDIYDTPAALTTGVDAVALVTAERTEPGPSYPGDNGGSPVAYVLNHFTLDQVLKGPLTPGASVTVAQTAELHDDGTVVGIDSDGGPFAAGAQFLVFLNRTPGADTWYVVSYQGRYNIQDGTVKGVHADDPVVNTFHMRPLTEVLNAVAHYSSLDVVRQTTD